MARTKTLLRSANTEALATAALEQALNPIEGRENAWTLDQVKRHGSPMVRKLVSKLAKPLTKAPAKAPKAAKPKAKPARKAR